MTVFIDTWVWLEFLGKKSDVGNVLSNPEKITSAAVITELKYHCAKKFGGPASEDVIFLLENDTTLKILPVTTEIAKSAADIRLKYYDKSSRPLSFIDCINFATAIFTGCEKFYTGDEDFEGLEEVKVEILN